jgi:ribosomal protein L37AE/L43A
MVMNLIANILEAFVGRSKTKSTTNRETIIRNKSLTCNKCDNLASPIPNTGRIYKCNNCGRQFSSTPHNL